MSNKASCLLFALIVLSACSKKEFASPPPDDTEIKKLGKLDCDPAYAEHIRGMFNNTDICFNTILSTIDTFSNAYYKNESIHLDHINLIRRNLDKTMSCQLHFVNPDLHNKTLPYVLPHAAPDYNEYAEIVITDLNKLWSTNIDDDYIGGTYKGFSVTITDTTGGYLTGSFKGEATTKQGKKVVIDAGDFYIRAIHVDKD